METEQKKKCTLNNYVITKRLGNGANSDVFLAFEKDTGDPCAIKMIRSSTNYEKNRRAIINEARILQKLNNHPNIIKIYEIGNKGVFEDKKGRVKNDVLYEVLQFVNKGEIYHYLAYTGGFPEPVARYYYKQLISALDYMHSNGYAHRDLKPANLLLDNYYDLLLADFGFSTPLSGKDGTGKLKSVLGTTSYMAPEIHSKAPYLGTLVDIFTSGILLFVFVTGHPPFNQATPNDPFYNLICVNNHERFWNAHSRKKPGGLKFFSPEFMMLMNYLLAFDPTKRPSISEIKAHPWYEGKTATKEEVYQELSLRRAKVDRVLERQRIAKEKKESLEK